MSTVAEHGRIAAGGSVGRRVWLALTLRFVAREGRVESMERHILRFRVGVRCRCCDAIEPFDSRRCKECRCRWPAMRYVDFVMLALTVAMPLALFVFINS
jgi:hypothetical protein